MWLFDPRRRLLSKTILIWFGLLPLMAQPVPQQPYEFFSGEVVELSSDHLTVERKAKGKEQQRHTFTLRPETKVEGRLTVKARVTVGFKPGDQGDVAVRVIVRPHPVPATTPKGF